MNRTDLLKVTQDLINDAEGDCEYVAVKRKDLDALCAAVNQPEPDTPMLEIYVEPEFGAECICVDGPGDGSGFRFQSPEDAAKMITTFIQQELERKQK